MKASVEPQQDAAQPWAPPPPTNHSWQTFKRQACLVRQAGGTGGGASGPYLDKLAGASHTPIKSLEDGTSAWEKVSVQAIPVPDLNHTRIRTSFTYQGATFMRPDGSVHADLREQIRDRVRIRPKQSIIVDTADVQHLDHVRSVRRSNTLQYGASNMLRRAPTSDGSVTNDLRPTHQIRESLYLDGSTIDDTIGSVTHESTVAAAASSGQGGDSQALPTRKTRKRRPPHQPRLKKPYSQTSLLNCLLDLEYGQTSASLTNTNSFDWEIGDLPLASDHHPESKRRSQNQS